MTEHQRRVLLFIQRYFAEHLRSPTVREIRSGLAIGNVSAVQGVIVELERRGHICRTNDRVRKIKVLKPVIDGTFFVAVRDEARDEVVLVPYDQLPRIGRRGFA